MEVRDELGRCLSCLAGRQLEVVLAYLKANLNLQAAGKLLGVTREAVRQHLSRAYEQIRACRRARAGRAGA